MKDFNQGNRQHGNMGATGATANKQTSGQAQAGQKYHGPSQGGHDMNRDKNRHEDARKAQGQSAQSTIPRRDDLSQKNLGDTKR